jgi:hypothetical protein
LTGIDVVGNCEDRDMQFSASNLAPDSGLVLIRSTNIDVDIGSTISSYIGVTILLSVETGFGCNLLSVGISAPNCLDTVGVRAGDTFVRSIASNLAPDSGLVLIRSTNIDVDIGSTISSGIDVTVLLSVEISGSNCAATIGVGVGDIFIRSTASNSAGDSGLVLIRSTNIDVDIGSTISSGIVLIILLSVETDFDCKLSSVAVSYTHLTLPTTYC